MKCNMKREPYVSSRGYQLYVCTRKGCRGHGFDRGHGIPERTCDHPRQSLRIGTILQMLLLPIGLLIWVFGISCKCKQRRDYLNAKYGVFFPSFLVKAALPPWEDEAYKSRLIWTRSSQDSREAQNGNPPVTNT